ncbi:MAG: secondary thiamine-phosphate synthase enzyme YjbQ [Candidatus Methanomethylophilaceae archaeon]|jgi:secondary thiamine-phosphate synthase enzyme
MHHSEITLSTRKEEMIDITSDIRKIVKESTIKNGICLIYCPHTTAAITINENADPDVKHDLLMGLDKAFPDEIDFKHEEGNSSAHLKSSCIGCSKTVIIENNDLVLGTWQGIYFCEFDGPRKRTTLVKILSD